MFRMFWNDKKTADFVDRLFPVLDFPVQYAFFIAVVICTFFVCAWSCSFKFMRFSIENRNFSKSFSSTSKKTIRFVLIKKEYMYCNCHVRAKNKKRKKNLILNLVYCVFNCIMSAQKSLYSLIESRVLFLEDFLGFVALAQDQADQKKRIK